MFYDLTPTTFEAHAKAFERLDYIRGLPDNWDEDGAPGFTSDLIDSVQSVVSNLRHIPLINPTGRPSIQLEYFSRERGRLLFEFFEGGQIWMYRRDNKWNWSEEPIVENAIYEAVTSFHEQQN